MTTSILIAEGDPDLAEVVIETFSSNEYSVRAVSTLEDAIASIEKEAPDVVLVSDELSKGGSEELCRKLHNKRGQADAPALILLTSESKLHQILGFNAWVDACLRRPVDPVILESTVESIVRRRKKQAPSNPLTKLPDTLALSREMERRTSAGETFSVRTFRFDEVNADAYRRKYGELKYLTMVRLAAHTIAHCALDHGGKGAFAAHGGSTEAPEFVVLAQPEKARDVAKSACEEFDANCELLYDKKDRMEGSLVEIDEAGKKSLFPFVSLLAEVLAAEKAGIPRS